MNVVMNIESPKDQQFEPLWEAWKKLHPSLREDQLKALAVYSEIIDEIIKSKEPLAVAMFWISESDLLGDACITWISNLKKEKLRDLMRHGIKRINKQLKGSIKE